jgi:hypothetical protein
MSSRRRKPVREDYPPPWEPRPISLERWQRHRTTLMARATEGHRPEEWWAYERNMDKPADQAATLYAMGELQGTELELVLKSWRTYYKTARGYSDIQEQREFIKWAGIPAELVKQWDRERKHAQLERSAARRRDEGSGNVTS